MTEADLAADTLAALERAEADLERADDAWAKLLEAVAKHAPHAMPVLTERASYHVGGARSEIERARANVQMIGRV